MIYATVRGHNTDMFPEIPGAQSINVMGQRVSKNIVTCDNEYILDAAVPKLIDGEQ